MIMSLTELLELVPRRANAFQHMEARPAIPLEPAVVENYVWPELLTDSSTEAITNSPVLLVTAPGAMGKSAAALSVASATNGLYVDLARMHVGSGTLTGEVSKALGFNGASAFYDSLANGEVSLILDSTDEAQLRTGTQSFIEFIRDLAWPLKSAKPASQVLMFGRADSIDLTLLAFDELGINPPVLEISALNHASSSELIDLRLDVLSKERKKPTVHRQHPEPFGRLRDLVFADIMRSLTGSDDNLQVILGRWHETQAFLGYPPVLGAVAERLMIDNPNEEISRINTQNTSTRRERGELLQQIAEWILDRESDKVRRGLGERLGIRADDDTRSLLYTRDEQIARVLRKVGVDGVRIELPAVLEDDERKTYEDLIENFVQDHPFLRKGRFASEVFSDYVRGWAVSSPVRGAWITDNKAFVTSLPEVGPFFATFVSALRSEERASIPEWQLNDIVRSHKLGSRAPWATFVQRSEAASLVLSTEDSSDRLFFEVTELSGITSFAGPLTKFTLVTDMGVALEPSPSGQIDIGPDVVIVAEHLKLSGTHVQVVGRDADSGFSMLSAAQVEQPNFVSVTAHPQNALLIDFPEAWHQWKPFMISPLMLKKGHSRATVAQVLVGARRMLSSFRASISEAPTVLAEKVDFLLVGKNPIYAATRDALLRLDVLRKEGLLYALNLGRLADFHVSYSDLRGDDPAKALAELCEAILEEGSFGDS